jgi:hypothetical protein
LTAPGRSHRPVGLAWAIPGPIIYAFYLTANARLLGRHPPLIGAGFLYGGLAAAYLDAVLRLGASLPTSAPGWLSPFWRSVPAPLL